MKELKAYIREGKMHEVVRGLRTRGAQAMTVVRVIPLGSEVEPEFVDTSSAVPVAHYTPMVKLELVCDERQVEVFADTIRQLAQTGDPGDGVIFVSDVDQALHIRTGRRDQAAL